MQQEAFLHCLLPGIASGILFLPTLITACTASGRNVVCLEVSVERLHLLRWYRLLGTIAELEILACCFAEQASFESNQSVGHYSIPVYQCVGSILSVTDHAEESSDYSWMEFVVDLMAMRSKE